MHIILRALALIGALAAPIALGAQDIDRLTEAASSGDAAAQYMLAERYQTGDGVLQSYARAAQWFALAAEQGDHRAQYELGRQLVGGLGVAADPSVGLALLRAASESGDRDHLFALGQALQAGVGTQPDPSSAAQAFGAAVDAGSDEAAVALALLHYAGDGVEQSVAKTIELLTGPAERGNATAQNNLGLIYARGDAGTTDYETAFKWFNMAAESGLTEGLRNLAAMYENGFAVPVDETRAQALLRQAAAGGSSALTYFSDSRLAVPDPQEIERYARAASVGDPISNFNLAMVLVVQPQVGGPEMRAAAGAFQTAARRGIPAAMANYGLMMFEGRGVLQDFVEGYAWMTVAVSMGLPGALESRDKLAQVMTVKQINQAQGLSERLWQDITGRAAQ